MTCVNVHSQPFHIQYTQTNTFTAVPVAVENSMYVAVYLPFVE